jgi:hypothetical protein
MQLSGDLRSRLSRMLNAERPFSSLVPDFSRYAKNVRAVYIQGFIIPVVFTLTAFIVSLRPSLGRETDVLIPSSSSRRVSLSLLPERTSTERFTGTLPHS